MTALDVTGCTQLYWLDCRGNKLSSLNVSDSSALNYLNCRYNELTSLTLPETSALTSLVCNNNELTTLDITGCASLDLLYCQNNKLSSLNLSNAPKLRLLGCSSNDIETLDVANKIYLEILFCDGNKITSLNLSGSPALKQLRCYTNELTSLNVTNSTSLDILYCQDNKLTALDLSNNPAITELFCYSNDLTSLNLTACASLDKLSCYSNKLTALDLSGNSVLTYLRCQSNDLTSLNLTSCVSLDRLDCYNNQLTALDVSNLTSLRVFNCHDNKITSLNLSGHYALVTLNCYSNELQTLDVTGCYNLRVLECQDNKLGSLNLSDCVRLVDLLCNNNELTSLNVTGCSVLVNLACANNNLVSLNVSDSTLLQRLECSDNRIKTLDLSGFAALTGLWCDNNELTVLNLRGCVALKTLYCLNNRLTELNLNDCTALNALICDSNRLSALNVNNCTALQLILCYNNQISELDVSRCTDLRTLDCASNSMTRLYVSGCRNLVLLSCANNLLTTLNLRNNTALETLDCQFNYLTDLDISANVALVNLNCMSNDIAALDLSRNSALLVLSNDSALETLHVVPSGRSDYPYSLNLSGYVGSNVNRIISVKAYDSEGYEIPTLIVETSAAIAGATVLFASYPSRVIYEYDTGYSGSASISRTMSVVLSLPAMHMYIPRAGGFWVANINLDDGLTNAVANAFSGITPDDVKTFHSVMISETWTLSSQDESLISGEILYRLPEVKADVDGAYTLMCIFEVGMTSADKIRVHEVTDSGTDYVFLDESYNVIDYVPDSRAAYLALKLPAGKTNRSVVVADIPGTIVGVPSSSGGSGGCDSGLGILSIVGLLSLVKKRKKTGLLVLCLVLIGTSSSFADVEPSDYALPIPLENYTPAGTCRTDFAMTPELADKVASSWTWPNKGRKLTSADVHSFSEISLGTWEFTTGDVTVLDNTGAYGAALLPLTENGTGNDTYVVFCELSNDVQPGKQLGVLAMSIDVVSRRNLAVHYVNSDDQYEFGRSFALFLDENFNRIYNVPQNRKFYAAVSLSNTNSGIVTVIRGQYVPENDPLERIHPSLAQFIADDFGIEVSQLKYIRQDGLLAPRAATEAMKRYMASDDREVMLNMPTVSVDQGYQAVYFVYTFPESVWKDIKGKSFDEYRIYALNDDGISDSEVKSSFVLNGVISLWELNGGKLDSFGVREVVLAALLQAGKPFSLYLAKMLLMLLLGGCNVGSSFAIPLVGVSVLALIIVKVKFRK